MGLQKITFEGGNVSAKKDADLYYFLFSNRLGILKGIKAGVTYTLSNNTITFQDGYIAVYGRLIYIENNTSIQVSPDSTKNGYVILGVDTNSNDVTMYLKEQTSGFPTLISNQLVQGDGLYEFPLASYSKTSTSVTLTPSFERPIIQSYSELITNIEIKLRSELEPRVKNPTIISSGVYRIYDTSSYELYRSILLITIGSTNIVTVPGASLFYQIGSSNSVTYSVYGTTYSLHLKYENGYLNMTCGSTSHIINKVIVYKF